MYQPLDTTLDLTNKRVISVVNAQYISSDQIYNSSRIDSCDMETGTTSVLATEITATAASLSFPISSIALDGKTKRIF